MTCAPYKWTPVNKSTHCTHHILISGCYLLHPVVVRGVLRDGHVVEQTLHAGGVYISVLYRHHQGGIAVPVLGVVCLVRLQHMEEGVNGQWHVTRQAITELTV